MSHAIPYRGRDHGSFADEWGIHRGCSEWWYVTGYLRDEDEKLFSFQLTLIRARLSIFRPCVLMLALTDFESGRHRYSQRVALLGKDVRIDDRSVSFADLARLEKGKTGMTLKADADGFSLDLALEYGKGAVWHCDNGFLRMGIDEPGQSTIYYSYTNMPTAGTITMGGASKTVRGKSWMDKQGGPYSIMNRSCMWEWFSLRFFDDEEMMLFSFPQSGYQDGTYIRGDGRSQRLNRYTIVPADFTYPDGKTKYSSAWEIAVPALKEERYTVKPLLPGQMNIGYYELLAGIWNPRGDQVGLCFVELLPGVHNEKFPRTLLTRNSGNPGQGPHASRRFAD